MIDGVTENTHTFLPQKVNGNILDIFWNLIFFGYLRSIFFSYRLPDLVEYIVEPLLAGLSDHSSYVRRSAVMGCVKMFHLIPDFVEGIELIDSYLSYLYCGSTMHLLLSVLVFQTPILISILHG